MKLAKSSFRLTDCIVHGPCEAVLGRAPRELELVYLPFALARTPDSRYAPFNHLLLII